ncbi:MAG: ATP-binding protein, partial [Anaerolineae bacterium]
PRQQTLRALIDWSWDLLSDAERALLRRLSVFLSGWTLEAAEAIGVGDGVEERDVLELLTRLVEKSLVLVEERGVETRYTLLETIRQYARDKLLESGESERARTRHLNFFLQLSDEAEPKLRAADQLTWLARLETEHDNLRAALKWSLGSREIEAGLRLAGNLSRFWYLHGYWNEGREWLKLMLSRSASDTTLPEPMARARAKALCGAGWLSDDNGDEIPLYTESLALYRQIGDKWGEAFSLRGLVAGASSWGSPEHVLPRLQESLTLCRELQDAWCTALALYNLGWLALSQDDDQQAETTWEDGLNLFRESGDRWGIAVSLNALGYVARLRGKYSRATVLTEESLTLFRELGDKLGIAMSLTRLGNVAFRRGDYVEATALLEESLAVQRERGDQSGGIDSLYLLGQIACYQGNYQRAVTVLEEGLALARELGDLYNSSYALDYLALVAYYQSDIERAATLWQESLALHREQEDKDATAYSLYGLGLVAQRQRNYPLAAERLEESLAVYQTAGDKRYIAIALYSLGQLAQAQGDHTRALSLLRESLIIRKKMGAKRGIAESLEGFASVIVAGTAEQLDRAARLFGAAQGIRETIGAPVPPIERADYDRSVADARAQLGEAAFASVWAEGRAMALEQAVAYALETKEVMEITPQ